ncbi:hypothetical protein FSP39_005465 [Pinctada imbricata]|uniref:Endonuclease III homolog n=1 Tax=Pinctada imbricata TaxID=66713 RepID=A0AA89BNP6_PINIB|nr:hypothetical protein FSP39_005465 [Pinctada imbricata]
MTESPYFPAVRRVTRSSIPNEGNVQAIKRKNVPSKVPIKKEKIEISYEGPSTLVHIKQDPDIQNVESTKVKKEPLLWHEQLMNIQEMRKFADAPVDSMGCDVISDERACPEVYRYQVLVSLMLSSQTKDQVTSAAMTKLRAHGCNISNILSTPDEKLGELIYPVGFWKRKVEYIKKTSKILQEKYNEDIPDSVEGLCKLPGVGPKMAYLAMKCAWGQVVGIGVDTHVHRISNRLGWVKTKQPEDTRKALEDWLPREHWSSINHLLVGFGQQICTPVGPKCVGCLNNTICPVGKSEMRSPNKKLKVEKKEET